MVEDSVVAAGPSLDVVAIPLPPPSRRALTVVVIELVQREGRVPLALVVVAVLVVYCAVDESQ